ncbi:cysteine desulfurase family protein [Methylomarinum sp. Ch1-1]|uniref:cysteine desulfurase n=1 Tax=Methylomarinum roseum TaxID=3067653 RepID=A0AAU7NUE5_9GAMM
MIYFDHNATTPLDERVLEAMLPYLQSFYGNPSSLYRLGRIARSAIETAREQVAALVDVHPSQVVFTSGGTEANNLALNNIPNDANVAVSAIEHPSIIEPLMNRRDRFQQINLIGVDEMGRVKTSAIDSLALKNNDFVSIMLANNETGVIQDIAALSARLKPLGVTVHSDAVQALGKIPVSFAELGIDLMSLSSHKIYGPKGCGALLAAKGFDLKPLLLGGGQENNCRSGTENVAAIVGFGKAAELAKTEMAERRQKALLLRDQLQQALLELPGVVIFSREAERLPNTVQMSIAGMDGEMLLMQLDRKNIAVSSGSACAAAGGQPSPVLTAMGVDESTAKGAIRISLGKDSSEQDVIEFISVLNGLF